MMEIYNKYKSDLNKKNSILIVISIIFILGIIFGSIYISILDNTDKKVILDNISNYFNSLNKISIENKIDIFKDSLLSNLLYYVGMWVLGISSVGLPIIIIMVFLKAFTISFSISSIFAKYKLKGIIGALLYIFPSKIITIIFTILLAAYSITISIKLIQSAFTRKTINFKSFMGRYLFLLVLSILVGIITALLDAFVCPYIQSLFNNFIK